MKQARNHFYQFPGFFTVSNCNKSSCYFFTKKIIDTHFLEIRPVSNVQNWFSLFFKKILGLIPTLTSCTKSYLKLLTRAKIPHGMTINPTSRSATARDTIKKLVEVCRLFSLLTLNITAQFPTTAISGRKTVTKLKKFRWRGCVTSESESSVTFW